MSFISFFKYGLRQNDDLDYAYLIDRNEKCQIIQSFDTRIRMFSYQKATYNLTNVFIFCLF